MKKFDEFDLNENTNYFDIQKEAMINEFKNILLLYDKFTKSVAPQHWRTTGHHYAEIKKMIKEFNNFTEITEEEKIKTKDFL